MRKENKFVYVLIFMFLIGIVICLVLLKKQNNNTNTDKNVEDTKEEVVLSGDKFKLVDDQNMYFSLQKAINLYYSNLSNEMYINKIIIDEPEEFDNLENISYSMTKAYFQNIDDTTCAYIVCGYNLEYSYIEDGAKYVDNVCYFIYKASNTIRLKRLDIDNIDTFVSNLYYKGYINLERGASFSESTTSNEAKLSIYLSNFINLIINKPEVAYEYLDSDMQSNLGSYDNFLLRVADIYDKISPVIFNYIVNEVNGVKVYTVVDDNRNDITIKENSFMDYKLFINID